MVDDGAGASGSKGIDELREVIRYQRSKTQACDVWLKIVAELQQIAETECEQSKLEVQRLQQRLKWRVLVLLLTSSQRRAPAASVG